MTEYYSTGIPPCPYNNGEHKWRLWSKPYAVYLESKATFFTEYHRTRMQQRRDCTECNVDERRWLS